MEGSEVDGREQQENAHNSSHLDTSISSEEEAPARPTPPRRLPRMNNRRRHHGDDDALKKVLSSLVKKTKSYRTQLLRVTRTLQLLTDKMDNIEAHILGGDRVTNHEDFREVQALLKSPGGKGLGAQSPDQLAEVELLLAENNGLQDKLSTYLAGNGVACDRYYDTVGRVMSRLVSNRCGWSLNWEGRLSGPDGFDTHGTLGLAKAFPRVYSSVCAALTAISQGTGSKNPDCKQLHSQVGRWLTKRRLGKDEQAPPKPWIFPEELLGRLRRSRGEGAEDENDNNSS